MQTLLLQWNGTSWVQVLGDNTGPTGLSFQLTAVSAIAANDVWGVGYDGSTLAEHWGGTAWGIVPTPNAGIGQNVLNAVSGTSSNDVWQVGSYDFGAEQLTLTEHWNGTAWTIVPSPNSGKVNNVLSGVVAISPSNVWAVGSADSGVVADQTTLVLHWDGSGWRVVASPSPGTAGLNSLSAVAANSSTDVWAVGSYLSTGNSGQVLIERWNGSTWNIVPGANVAGTNNGLYGLVALGLSNLWAVGYSGSGTFAPLIEQWNGSSWSIVPSPDPQNTSSILRAAASSGASDVWSAGYATNLSVNKDGVLIEHWNGSNWSLSSGISPYPGPSDLYSVAAVSPGDAWVVGTTGGLTLIERWNGSSWSVFASPSPNAGDSLLAAAPITSCDVWAVGETNITDVGAQTLSEHFTCN
jgi:hypothetical protein